MHLSLGRFSLEAALLIAPSAVSCGLSALAHGSVLLTQAPSTPAVSTYLKTAIEQSHTPGVSFAVVRNGSVVALGGYGLANVETDTPATAETAYKIASLSKSLISAAVVMLIKEKKLRLNDNACSLLENCPASWKSITVYQLLTHTSGLVRDPIDYQPYVNQPIKAIIDSAYSIPLQSTPGDKWLYSNLGYYVLAEIITRASGELWSALIAERILRPAGMKETELNSTIDVVPHRANGYQWKDGRLINAENWMANRPSSAYISTVSDLMKWEVFLEERLAEDPSIWGLVWTASKLPDGKSTRYGFGWYSDRYLDQPRIHHDGEYPGFRTEMDHFPKDDLNVIVLANSDSFPAERSALQLAGIFDPNLKAPGFDVECQATASTSPGKPAPIHVQLTNNGVASDDTLLEVEVWDRAGKVVYKDNRNGLFFTAGQRRDASFSWSPAQPGDSTIYIGVYGPRWITSFAWKRCAATIHVDD